MEDLYSYLDYLNRRPAPPEPRTRIRLREVKKKKKPFDYESLLPGNERSGSDPNQPPDMLKRLQLHDVAKANPGFNYGFEDDGSGITPPDVRFKLGDFGGNETTPSNERVKLKDIPGATTKKVIPDPTVTTEPSIDDRIRLQQDSIRHSKDMENNPVKNNDDGILGRLLDIGREALIGAGQTYQQGLRSGLSAKEALYGSIGGGIAGGAYGGLHPQADEERVRLREINKGEQELGRLQTQKGQQQKDEEYKQKRLKLNADILGKNASTAKTKVDTEGKRISNQQARNAYEYRNRNGRVMRRRKTGGGWEPVKELGITKGEVEGEIKFNGHTYYLTSKEALALDLAMVKGNVSQQFQILKANTAIENKELGAKDKADSDYEKRVSAYEKRKGDLLGKVQSAQTRINSLNSRLEVIGGEISGTNNPFKREALERQKGNILKDLTKAEGDLAGALTASETLREPKRSRVRTKKRIPVKKGQCHS